MAVRRLPPSRFALAKATRPDITSSPVSKTSAYVASPRSSWIRLDFMASSSSSRARSRQLLDLVSEEGQRDPAAVRLAPRQRLGEPEALREGRAGRQRRLERVDDRLDQRRPL